MRLGGFGWLALALAGCGGVRVPPAVSSTVSVATERVGERAVIVVERPMEGHAAITVWLDAGSLDGPEASLLAAELVASSADLEVTVLPDGTRVRRMCTLEALDGCVREIDAALARRSYTDEALEDARRAVSARRARGSGSSRREAERLATSAALGLELTPLGDPDAIVDRGAVEAFLDDHYGSDRSLWIAVGDLEPDRLAQALSETPTRGARAARLPRVTDEAAARVRAAEHAAPGYWAIAWRAPDAERAQALANAWSHRRLLAQDLEVSAFPTRAGWVALVSFARRADDDVTRWVGVVAEPADSEVADETAWELADRLGTRWVAGETPDARARAGVALVGEDAEGSTRAIELDAERDPFPDAVLVPVANTMGVSVAWALPGPTDDGASAFGASRIAAELLSHRCASEATIRVEGDAVLVTETSDLAGVRGHASRWSDCVVLSEPTADEVEAVRRVLVARASLDDERLAAVARAIAPAAPGVLAPRASRQALSDVPTADVLARWRSWRDAGRWSFAGAVERAGGEAPPEQPVDLMATEVRVRASVERPELVLVEALAGCGEVGYGAALARAWASHARRRGLEVTWQHSGATRVLAWGAVAVRGDATVLAEMARAVLAPAERNAASAEAMRAALVAHASLASTAELARRGALGAAAARCEGGTLRANAWLEPHPSSGRR